MKRYRLCLFRPGQTHGTPLAQWESDDPVDLERIGRLQDSELRVQLIDRVEGTVKTPEVCNVQR